MWRAPTAVQSRSKHTPRNTTQHNHHNNTIQSGTGTWLGPAPRGYAGTATGQAAQQQAAQAAQQPVREPETILLASGARMPLLGLGTYKLARPEAVKRALELGYRSIDCAAFYGNQAVVGEGLKEFIASGRRDELFVTTKVWQTEHRPELARASALRSIEELGVGHLDLLLVHWPEAWVPGSTIESWQEDATVTIADTWRALEALVDEGLVRGLGVSNFSLAQVEALLSAARHKPLVNQVELHPLLAQRKLVGVLLRRGVACVAYSPLGAPSDARPPELLTNPVVADIAARAGRTPAQVLLRYNMQRGVPVIPKAGSDGHLAENFSHAFDWRLSNADKAALDALDAGRRFVSAPWHEWEDPEEGGALKPSVVLKGQQQQQQQGGGSGGAEAAAAAGQ